MCRRKDSVQNVTTFHVSKGDDDIMDDVEKLIANSSIKTVETIHTIYMKSVRRNMESEVRILNRDASRLNGMDWILFFVTIICVTIISSGFNPKIDQDFSLSQIFGMIALFTKSIEKGCNLSKIVRDKRICASSLSGLIREMAMLEMELLTNKEGADILTKDMLNKVNKIWAKFNDVGLRAFTQPSNSDKKDYGTFVSSSDKEVKIPDENKN